MFKEHRDALFKTFIQMKKSAFTFVPVAKNCYCKPLKCFKVKITSYNPRCIET